MRQQTARVVDGSTLSLGGVEIEFYRDRNGLLTIAVSSDDTEDDDMWESGIPILRLDINASNTALDEDGDWVELDPDSDYALLVQDRRQARESS